jgi:predicted NBD/HSP70 family sugar kinase
MTTCLALDFGGSSVKHALVASDGSVSEVGRVPAPLGSRGEFVDAVKEVYTRYADQVSGIGISIPGYVDPNTGFLAGSGVYTDLHGVGIQELLEQQLPVKVAVENDGKCAALSEGWNGALAETGDGAVVILGTGIAGGLISRHQVRHGRGFAAGEFSYLLTDPTDDTLMGTAFMTCGMLGITYRICKAKNLDLSIQDSGGVLEWLDSQFAGRYAPAEGASKAIKADGRQVFQWLDAEDPDAEKVYTDVIVALATMVHNIQVSYGPERIAIGGGVSNQRRVLDDLRTELERRYTSMGLSDELRAHVVQAVHLDEGNAVGAAYNYFSRHEGLEVR